MDNEEITLVQKLLIALFIVIALLGMALIGGFDDADARRIPYGGSEVVK